MVVPQNRWFEMVSFMENPMNKWMIWRNPHDSGNPMKPPYHQKSASESSHVIYAEIRRCQCSLFPRCGREEIRDLKWLWKWLDVYWKIKFWVMVPDTVANCSQAIFMTMLKSIWKWLVISYHRTPGTGRKKHPLFFGPGWGLEFTSFYLLAEWKHTHIYIYIYIWVWINTY